MQAPSFHGRFRTLIAVAAAAVLAASISIADIALPSTVTPPEPLGLNAETSMPRLAADWWRAFGHDGLSSIVDCALPPIDI